MGAWEEWGEGPRGKGSERGSRPTRENRKHPGQKVGRGQQPTNKGPYSGNQSSIPNGRPGQPDSRDVRPVATNGQLRAGDKQPSVTRGQVGNTGQPYSRNPQGYGRGSHPNPDDNHPGDGGGGWPDGGGGDVFVPTGPLRMNLSDDYAPVKLFSQLQPFMNRHLSDPDWNRWCSLLDRWTQVFSQWSHERTKQSTPTPQAAWTRRQQNRRPNDRQPNPQQARNPIRNRTITRMVATQKAYEQHPKCCMATLRKSPPPTRCTVPVTMVGEYFRTKLGAVDPNTPTGPPPIQLWQGVTPTDLLEAPFTDDEVSNTLKRTNPNSAPGPDHLSYAAWKKPGRSSTAPLLLPSLTTAGLTRKSHPPGNDPPRS